MLFLKYISNTLLMGGKRAKLCTCSPCTGKAAPSCGQPTEPPGDAELSESAHIGQRLYWTDGRSGKASDGSGWHNVLKRRCQNLM